MLLFRGFGGKLDNSGFTNAKQLRNKNGFAVGQNHSK
jgi:hypothetical protein